MNYVLEHEWKAPKGYPRRLLDEATDRFTQIIEGYLESGFKRTAGPMTEIQGQTIIKRAWLTGPKGEAFDERETA